MCSDFNIEDGKKIHNIFGILCIIISWIGKNASEMQEKICAVYGEGAMTDQMCQKWFVKFLGTIDILAK